MQDALYEDGARAGRAFFAEIVCEGLRRESVSLFLMV